MPVDPSGSAAPVFDIKSANMPLVALLLRSADLAELARDLQARYGDMPEFFDNDPLLVDLSALQDSAELPDFPALIALLRSHRMQPLAVRGGNAAQMTAAEAAGLVPAPDALLTRTPAQPPAPPMPVAPPPPQAALVVDRPLRSGQQVYARGRDLVVLAMVNPGAEVVADGHIHVYAPLRGRAIAGALGNPEARIFSLAMEPELISIAGIYQTSENALPTAVAGKPAQVRLVSSPEGDRLVMEPIKS